MKKFVTFPYFFFKRRLGNGQYFKTPIQDLSSICWILYFHHFLVSVAFQVCLRSPTKIYQLSLLFPAVILGCYQFNRRSRTFFIPFAISTEKVAAYELKQKEAEEKKERLYVISFMQSIHLTLTSTLGVILKNRKSPRISLILLYFAL